jgi:hypothetical protein
MKNKEQFKHVDSKFGTSAQGVINVNFEEILEEPEQTDNENEVSCLSKFRVEESR